MKMKYLPNNQSTENFTENDWNMLLKGIKFL